VRTFRLRLLALDYNMRFLGESKRGGRVCQGSMLPHLPQRPFRTLPGGTLRKFPRGLGQFPFSFLAESRWVPRFSGEVAPACRPSAETWRVRSERPLGWSWPQLAERSWGVVPRRSQLRD